MTTRGRCTDPFIETYLRLLLADSVEEVRESNRAGLASGYQPFLSRLWAWDWYQFGQLSQVLGRCCEEELVMGTFWSS